MGYQTTFTHDVWHREAETLNIRNGIRTRRWGMRVTVYNDPVAGNNGDWVLSYNLANTNRQSNLNWLKVADIGDMWGGASGILTADNGLTVTGTNVQWGGTLIGNTTIDGAFDLGFFGQTDIIIVTDGGGYFEMDPTGAIYMADGSSVANLGMDSSGVFFSANGAGTIQFLAENLPSSTQMNVNVDDITMVSTDGVNTSQMFMDSSGYMEYNAEEIAFYSGGAEFEMLGNNWEAGATGNVELRTSSANTTMLLGVAGGSFNFMTGAIQMEDVAGVGNLSFKHLGGLALFQGEFLEAIIGDATNLTSGETTINTTVGDLTLQGSGNSTLRSTGGNTNVISNSGTVNITAQTGDLNLNPTGNFLLRGLASGSPATEFVRGDGTWAVPAGGSSISFGLVTQIPYTNATTDDFNYEAGFEYVAADDRLFVNNIRLGTTSIAGNRVIDFASSDIQGQLSIGNVSGNAGTINFVEGLSDVRAYSGLAVYTSAALATVAGYQGIQGRLGVVQTGIWSHSVHGIFAVVGNGTGQLATFRGGDVTATVGNASTSGSVLITPGVNANGTSAGDITSGDVLINSPAPFNAGVHGNLSIFNNTYASSPAWQAGEKIIFIGNRVTAPTGNPVNGGYLYVEAGALVYRGSGGTVTTIGPA